MSTRRAGVALAVLLGAGCACAADTPTLTVCMAENNPPLSYRVAGDSRGLDVRVAEAIAAELQRALKVVPFESKYEHESTLAVADAYRSA